MALIVAVDQLVHQRGDLVERELRRGVRVEYRGALGRVARAGEGRLHRERLHTDVGLHQRGKVGRQRADRLGGDAAPVGDARDLDAAAGRQVLDEQLAGGGRAVWHVAVEAERLARL